MCHQTAVSRRSLCRSREIDDKVTWHPLAVVVPCVGELDKTPSADFVEEFEELSQYNRFEVQRWEADWEGGIG